MVLGGKLSSKRRATFCAKMAGVAVNATWIGSPQPSHASLASFLSRCLGKEAKVREYNIVCAQHGRDNDALRDVRRAGLHAPECFFA